MLWLGQSPATAATCLLPLLDRRPQAMVAAVAALATYYALPFWMLARQPQVRAALQHPLGGRELAGGLAAALTASIGPWWCLGNALDRWARGATYDHDKTER